MIKIYDKIENSQGKCLASIKHAHVVHRLMFMISVCVNRCIYSPSMMHLDDYPTIILPVVEEFLRSDPSPMSPSHNGQAISRVQWYCLLLSITNDKNFIP